MTTREIETSSATFTDGAGTTLTVQGGTVTFQELPGFDLARREREVPREFSVTFKDSTPLGSVWLPTFTVPDAAPREPRGMNRAQKRRAGRRG